MSETLANMERLGETDYSTDEQWTGKRWIDGKKIYRKCFSITSNFTDAFVVSGDVDTFINLEGTRLITGGSTYVALPYVGAAEPEASYSISGYFTNSDKKFHPQIGSAVASSNAKIIWVFEYTKTTS